MTQTAAKSYVRNPTGIGLKPLQKGENSHTRRKAREAREAAVREALETAKRDALLAQVRERQEPTALQKLIIDEIAMNVSKPVRTARDQNTVDRLLRRLWRPTPLEPESLVPRTKSGREMLEDAGK